MGDGRRKLGLRATCAAVGGDWEFRGRPRAFTIISRPGIIQPVVVTMKFTHLNQVSTVARPPPG